MGLFSKLFGSRSQREIKKIQPIVDKILAMEESYAALSEEELKGKTAVFQEGWPWEKPWTIFCPRHSLPSGRLPGVCWA